MLKTFTPDDLLAHATDMMDRYTKEARDLVQGWRPADKTMELVLAELEGIQQEAAAGHMFLLGLFAKNDLLLDAEGAIPLDPRLDQLDRDFQALMLDVVDAYRNPAPAALQ
jgi:hypothetical protein